MATVPKYHNAIVNSTTIDYNVAHSMHLSNGS